MVVRVILTLMVFSISLLNATKAAETKKLDLIINTVFGASKSFTGMYESFRGDSWKPIFGGGVALEYMRFKYFLLGTNFTAKSVNTPIYNGAFPYLTNKIVLSLVLDLYPKLIFPIEFKSSKLVPFIGLGGGLILFFFPAGRTGDIQINLRAGTKYFFSEHWGISLEYLSGLNFSYFTKSHVANIGLIYSF